MRQNMRLRCWDKKKKVMLPSFPLFKACFAHNDRTAEMIIMLGTGLKDRHGKEIYEGDVLLCDDSNEDHEEFRTKVWFCNGQFLTQHYGFPVHSWCSKKESWCEVIGNVFDNPELMEVKE